MTRNEIKISSIQQLLPINDDLVNFEGKIKIQSVEGKSFEAVVVNQEDLDSGKTNFQTAQNGVIEASFRQDNNIPTAWYIALKSPEEMTVIIEKDIHEIKPFSLPLEMTKEMSKKTPFYKRKFFIFTIVALTAIGVGVTIYLLFRKNSKKEFTRPPTVFQEFKPDTPSFTPVSRDTPLSTRASTPSFTPKVDSATLEKQLMDRINSLPQI
jgi:hypothetical protein